MSGPVAPRHGPSGSPWLAFPVGSRRLPPVRTWQRVRATDVISISVTVDFRDLGENHESNAVVCTEGGLPWD
jgi:hypothetical protein